MRYRLGAVEIRTENAAKPIRQAASGVVRWIRRMRPVERALDYGCGKLRSAVHLAPKCRVLTLVDGNIQLDRIQTIGGKRTTVRAYSAQRWPSCRVVSVQEFASDTEKYDFILCANVLSSIPTAKARVAVLRRLAAATSATGRCLFVTQYTNSYFTQTAVAQNAKRHLDGWIIKNTRGYFFYGILNKPRLMRLVAANGFEVGTAWVEGQSAYVLAAPSREFKRQR